MKEGDTSTAQATVAGHPLHTILNDGPVALTPLSLGMDLLYLITGKDAQAQAAYYTMLGGTITAAAVSVTGLADYLALPDKGDSVRMASRHLVLNLALAVLYLFNLRLRAKRTPPSGTLPTFPSLVGVMRLFVSVWYAGRLVYEHDLG